MDGLGATRDTTTAHDAVWTPGAVARQLGIAPSTLRSWHRRYGVPAATGGSGPHRRYSEHDLAALTHMQELIADGVGVPAAARLAFPMTGTSPAVDALVTAALDLDADLLLTILDARIAKDGVSGTWERWCRPALAVFGGRLDGGREHVGECIDVLHLLAWAISAALQSVRGSASELGNPTVLLACVPGEHHTLPLEALRAVLAENAIPARLLGTGLPATAISRALKRTAEPADALVLWSQRPGATPFSIARACQARGTSLFLAGPGWTSPAPRGLPLVNSLDEAASALRACALRHGTDQLETTHNRYGGIGRTAISLSLATDPA
ncbi:MerR family transcriptional regulator [Amycolatopsis sp. lyj-90]|uniref:MerR family transcriptional regulator n=1 Tax=Amycolatopsis sp. lyj-90 TaxID=2789285 RepID=UPI00397B0A3B